MDPEQPVDSAADRTRPGPAYRFEAAGGCPHAANARLLARSPVADAVLPGEVAGAVVLGHDALREFLTHPDVAKDPRHFTALREGRVPDGWPLGTFATVPGMTTADGDDHRRLRSLVGAAFTPRRVAALRPRVEELVAALLDGLAGAPGDEPVDLRSAFALPLPLAVIAELLGVDEGLRERLHVLSDRLVATDAEPGQVLAARQEMAEVLGAVVTARTGAPGTDLTSALIAAREADGDRLSPQELVGTLLLLIVAGHETTLNLITNAVRALSAHPEQLDLVRTGRAGWEDVVEETLRWDSPVSYFPFRYPTRDLRVGGALIREGTPVLAGYSAAGRDPAVYGSDADRFDVTRSARHLSLGHGAHFCLGAPLARMEAVLALQGLYERFPALTVAVPDAELPRHAGFVGNSVRELPVRLR